MELSKKSDRLGEDKISSLLIKLSIPAITGMVIHSLYNIIDSIYVGRLSTEALSALSLAFPIQLFLISIGVGTGVGTSSLISRLLGNDEGKKANNVAEHVFFIAIIYGIIVGIAGFFFADDVIHIFTSNARLIELGQRYIKIIMIGSMAIFIPAIFNYILRGEGNTFVPMLTMLIGAILNIILDPFLIFGLWFFPRLGIEGAAYATVFSRLIGGIFIVLVLLKGDNEIELRLKDFTYDFQIIREMYQVGIPAMFNRLIFSCTMVVINRILGSFNTSAIAVMGIIFRLQSFFLMCVFGLNQGYLPLVGYNYGHGNPARMKRTIYLGGVAVFSFGILGFLLFQLFPVFLLQLFNRDPALLDIGIVALRRVSIAYPFMVLNIIGVATFQAIGRGVPSLLLTILRQVGLLLPFMYLLGTYSGLDASWLAFPLAEGITLISLAVWLRLTIKRAVSRMQDAPEEQRSII